MITDKDMSERSIIKNILKNSVVLLCDRHVKKASHEHIRKIKKMNLNKSNPEEIKNFPISTQGLPNQKNYNYYINVIRKSQYNRSIELTF